MPKLVAVVTGASSGIGKATVEKFLQEGYIVHGIDRELSDIRHDNYTHHLEDVRGLLPDIEEVSFLINSAGTENSGAEIDINLKGLINCTEKYGVQPYIAAVVTVAAASATTGADFPAYVASKGGAIAYTRNVAKRIAQYSATANSVSFGGVVTDFNSVVINTPELWRRVMDVTPLKKWTSTAECAEWIYFLCTVNRSMTGQDLVIDNGEMYNHTFVWKE